MEEIMEQLDTDGNGSLEEEEFVGWWCGEFKDSKMTEFRNMMRRKLNTDLFSAVWEGDEMLIQSFLDTHPSTINSRDTTPYGDNLTALHYACYKGNITIFNMLIERGANPTLTSALNVTPLFLAAQQDHLEIVKELLEIEGVRRTIGKAETETSLTAFEVTNDRDIATLIWGVDELKGSLPSPLPPKIKSVEGVSRTVAIQFPPTPSLGDDRLPVREVEVAIIVGSEEKNFSFPSTLSNTRILVLEEEGKEEKENEIMVFARIKYLRAGGMGECDWSESVTTHIRN